MTRDGDEARALFDELLLVLGPHVAKEEGSLFPMLRRSAELVRHVAVLEGEHAGLYDAADDLDDVPAEGRAAVAGRRPAGPPRAGRAHVQGGLRLFPAAPATLDGSD
ncbi:hemerythrin domain-containing protein [Blastococcus sp. TF02A-26]|uniref:hemerythrin domain-containing protein n=1 Tax=Blastococcus sp. TF02A-26 TaxID=2250577 RepID=UPI000DEB2D88|nr:hypothetical protein DQ240_22605 [Blastococcus sp. TF02A-26]